MSERERYKVNKEREGQSDKNIEKWRDPTCIL